MKNTRWIVLLAALVTFATLGVLVVVVVLQASELRQQEPVMQNHRDHCAVTRQNLTLARRKLLSDDPNTRALGLAQYRVASLGRWAEASMCTPIEVDVSCSDEDLPCQLHAIDWALVNVR